MAAERRRAGAAGLQRERAGRAAHDDRAGGVVRLRDADDDATVGAAVYEYQTLASVAGAPQWAFASASAASVVASLVSRTSLKPSRRSSRP